MIIDAAEQLINDAGHTEWSIRSLSRVLECAAGALYRHFPGGAAEIASEVRGREFVKLANHLDVAENNFEYPGLACLDPSCTAAHLVRRCHAYLDFVTANPSVYQHLFGPLEPGASPTPNEAIECAMVERPAILIQSAAKSRELNRPLIGHSEASQLSLFLWVQLHGFAHLRLSGTVGQQIDGLQVRLLVNLMTLAGFTIAATPDGLEAAAKAAAKATPPLPQTQITAPSNQTCGTTGKKIPVFSTG